MEFIIGICLFIVGWAIMEFIFMIASSYDDYGDNVHMSFIFTVVMVSILAMIFSASEDDSTDQAAQLEEQWSVEDIAEVIEGQDLMEQDTTEYSNSVESPESMILRPTLEDLDDTDETNVKVERPVPSNKFHIDASRRHYNTSFTYDPETKEICGDNSCVKVRLVQHTDGTYWACKRNWGACYEY